MAVNLSVVERGGGKHWTRDEIDRRTASEVKTPKPKALTPPKWLNKPAAALFRKYAKLMLELPEGVVSKLDTGTLARYCDNESAYGAAARHRAHWMEICEGCIPAAGGGDALEVAEDPDVIARRKQDYAEAEEQVSYWTGQMVKYEKICRGCATELGMTVSSRCRLVVPKTEKHEDADPLEELRRRFQA